MKRILVVALVFSFICVVGMAAKTADLDITLTVLKHSSIDLGWQDDNDGIFTWDPATDPDFEEDYTQYASCTIRSNSKIKVTATFGSAVDSNYVYGVKGKGIYVSHMSNDGPGTPYTLEEHSPTYTVTIPYNWQHGIMAGSGIGVFGIQFKLYKDENDGEWEYWDYENGSKTLMYTMTVENVN